MAGCSKESSIVVIGPSAAKESASTVYLADWQPVAKIMEFFGTDARPAEPTRSDPDFPPVPLAFPLPDGAEPSLTRKVVISPSIVAFDPPVADVTFEKVAGIPHLFRPNETAVVPTVIRGGVVGGASAAPSAGAGTSSGRGGRGSVGAGATGAAGPSSSGNGQQTVEVKVDSQGRRVIVVNGDTHAKASSGKSGKSGGGGSGGGGSGGGGGDVPAAPPKPATDKVQ